MTARHDARNTAMTPQTESFYDTVLFALGPVVLGYAACMVALLVSYARP